MIFTANNDHPESITRKIREYVQSHPGCTRAQILSALPKETSVSTVSSTLGRLQRQHVLINRGGFAQYASWHAVEPLPQPYFIDLAEELLKELSEIHHTQRAYHLANRLEDLIDLSQPLDEDIK